MSEVLKGRTALIVGQRLSTVMNADRIVVLRDGRVVEEGTHAALYALEGEYRHLFDMQFKGQEHSEAVEMDLLAVK